MKIDLDELELGARELEARNTMGEQDPAVTLALIKRIRDLELLGRLLVDHGGIVTADRAREILDFGAVLPETVRDQPVLRLVP